MFEGVIYRGWGRFAFTLIELLVVISIIALLIGILLPALGAARRSARQAESGTRMRGIHQTMVMFGQGNGAGEFYPGLDSDGRVAAAQVAGPGRVGVAGADPHGTTANALAILLNGNYITSDYIISPGERLTPVMENEELRSGSPAAEGANFSYAAIAYGRFVNALSGTETSVAVGERPAGDMVKEWQATGHTLAVVLGDRNTGDDAEGAISSQWTDEDSGTWVGSVVRNDNSVEFLRSAVVSQTQYGYGSPINTDDHLFVAGYRPPGIFEFGALLTVNDGDIGKDQGDTQD